MSNVQPPSLASWFISRLDEYENNYSISGDLTEVYHSKLLLQGKKKADRWYVKETVKNTFSYGRYIWKRNAELFLNGFKPAFRNIVKFKGYSLINLAGLAVAVTVALMIAFFIRGELEIDKGLKRGADIYRMEADDWALLGTPHGKLVKEEFAEIKEYVTFNNISYEGMFVKKADNSIVSLNNTIWATSGFFRVFESDFIAGDPSKALIAPYSIVLIRSDAMKLFDTVEVLGRGVVANKINFKVTGVIEDIKGVHFRTGSVISFATLSRVIDDKRFMTRLGSWNHATFLLLKQGTDKSHLENKINLFFDDLYLRQQNSKNENVFSLRNYREIYFCKDKFHEYRMKHGSMDFLMILGGIAVFIIILACINYINISTAISGLRAKEIGLRKTVGGSRGALILQFMTETAIICGGGFLLASLALSFAMPEFSRFIGSDMEFSVFDPWVIFSMLGIWFIVSVMAGVYPALYLTSFKHF